MIDRSNDIYDRPHTSESGVLICPACSTEVSPVRPRCRRCGFTPHESRGVLTYLPADDAEAAAAVGNEVDAFVECARKRSLRAAGEEILGTSENRTELLSEIYDVRRDLWRVLVAEQIEGTCLDVHAGFGRRSMLLAELADSVYAVDRDLSKLQVAAVRDDYDSSDRVTPIHTSVDRLPFAEGAFDTITADLTGSHDVESELAALETHLAEDGSLLFVADGWPRTTKFTEIAGIEAPTGGGAGSLTPGTAAGFRSLAQSIGFDDVRIYALFPTASRPLYAFDVESDLAVEKLFEFVVEDRGRLARFCEPLLSLANRTSVLEHCFPNYLVVCANDPVEPELEFSDPLVVAGRARSVVLDMAEDGVESIVKVPNKDAHAPLTERENTLLDELRSSGAEITKTIPDGEAADSSFGQTRTERPVRGTTLGTELDGTVESFRRVLNLGFDWLTDFQRSFRGPSVVRSPDEVRDDLRFEPVDLDPPAVSGDVETFTTAVHGDYLAGNVYVDDGGVVGVIDWEYGATAASPVVDAGMLLLDTATRTLGDLEGALRTILRGDDDYAAVARESVREYCDAVGLPYRTFLLYLPAAYLHRLRLDWQFDAVSTYTSRMADRVDRVQTVYDIVDEL